MTPTAEPQTRRRPIQTAIEADERADTGGALARYRAIIGQMHDHRITDAQARELRSILPTLRLSPEDLTNDASARERHRESEIWLATFGDTDALIEEARAADTALCVYLRDSGFSNSDTNIDRMLYAREAPRQKLRYQLTRLRHLVELRRNYPRAFNDAEKADTRLQRIEDFLSEPPRRRIREYGEWLNKHPWQPKPAPAERYSALKHPDGRQVIARDEVYDDGDE